MRIPVVTKVVAAVGVTLLMAFLLSKTQSVDSTQHNEYSASLLRLKESDAALDDAVLRTRYGLLTSYDPINAELTDIRNLQSRVNTPPTYIEPQQRAEMVRQLEAYGKELDHEDSLLQQFKSQNAVINNSLRYFPIATRNLVQKLGPDLSARPLTTNLNLLTADVLRYSRAPDQQLAEEIKGQLDTLSQAAATQPPSIQAELRIVLNHANTLLKKKPALDNLTKEVISVPTVEHAQTLYNSYSAHYDAAVKASSTYRLCLYVLSVVLLCLIILRLRNATRGLKVAKLRLEQEIRDRTQANEALQTEISDRKRAETYIDKLLRQNELLLNSVSEGICGLDLDGNNIFINPAAAKMVGWKAEDLIGKRQHVTFHHTRADGTPYPLDECPIYAAFKDGSVHHVTNEVFWRKDGTSFPVESILQGEQLFQTIPPFL